VSLEFLSLNSSAIARKTTNNLNGAAILFVLAGHMVQHHFAAFSPCQLLNNLETGVSCGRLHAISQEGPDYRLWHPRGRGTRPLLLPRDDYDSSTAVLLSPWRETGQESPPGLPCSQVHTNCRLHTQDPVSSEEAARVLSSRRYD
jgi:hypothetical protein